MEKSAEKIALPQIKLEIAPEPCEPCVLCGGPTRKIFTSFELDGAQGQPVVEITNLPEDWCDDCGLGDWADLGATIAAYEAALTVFKEKGADEISIGQIQGSIRAFKQHRAEFS